MKKKNNKGFTLVELIIVVAIIAVLAAVLAPQYLQYVERSRESNDLQIATSIMRAATAAVADPQNEVPGSATVTVGWDTASNGNVVVVGAADNANTTWHDAVQTAIDQVMGPNNIVAESAHGTTVDFDFSINASTGAITVAKASGAWVTEIGVSATVAP